MLIFMNLALRHETHFVSRHGRGADGFGSTMLFGEKI